MRTDMDDVITVSSDSDSDVEIVGYLKTKTDPPPLAAVRVDVGGIKLPSHLIELTDPRWTLPELKLRKRRYSAAVAVVDLTESDSKDGTQMETDNLLPCDSQVKESQNKNSTSNELDFNLQKRSSGDSTVSQPVQDCSNLTAKHRLLDFQPQRQKEDSKTHQLQTSTPNVKLVRMPFLETHVTELKTSTYSVYVTKDCTQMSLCLRQMDNNTLPPECISDFKMTTSNGPNMQPSVDESAPEVVEPLIEVGQQENSNELTSTQLQDKISHSPQSSADFPCTDKGSSVTTLKEQSNRDDERGDFCPSTLIPSPAPFASSQDEAQGSLPRELNCADVVPPAFESRTDRLEVNRAESRQSHISDHSSSHSLPIELDPSQPFNLVSPPHTSPISHNLKSQTDPIPSSEDTQVENTSERQFGEDNADEASNSFDLRCSISSDPPLSVSKTEDVDEGSRSGTYRGDLGIDSPVSHLWQDGSDGEVNEESRYDRDFRGANREDRHYVCPIILRKMAGATQSLTDNEDEEFETPEVLCRQSLSLVYITIDENYPESTLQLLSDLLEPGYYPPKDIISHLLNGILLDPQCPRHLCQHAFNLLMRTQRHHMDDKNTVPWDWELLTTVMANQENTNRLRWEVVRMLLEYIVQTLEDDFQAKRSISSLHHSIAKATLSCDQQFPRVREVIKWLFSAIVKSTEHGESREAAKDKDEQIRIVSILQRMLSLALEVDRSPALNSVKLSQELFHMFISNTSLRAHRMLLLESLQSKLLRCKLLEHLLDYACPLKVSVPMSLSLLLHFLKNCTLTPDPTDGTEKWQKWEELIHLLWMLLLSYNKAMKGYLCSSATEQRGSAGTLVYKPDDIVTKPAIREAVDSFLSRSQADIGQAIPLHMEESLTYLKDFLLDVSQC
ncbi:uncharacterized protein LOC128362953 [Scomber scombrus]|uniref:Uncharacterized protein LOC128362953 n=2 Tax=Scomber scombrus TaxID=13677 RepID=A0AAV1NCH4_SCOSC